MPDQRGAVDDKGLLPEDDVLAHVDLVAPDEYRGTGPGPLVRESGVRFGNPLVLPMEPEQLPPLLRPVARAGACRYLGLVFTFDLDELPDHHYYSAARCTVELVGGDAIAVGVELDGEASDLLDRLASPGRPVPRWLPARLRHRAAHHTVGTFGLRSATFGCSYRDPNGDLLAPRSYTMLAIVEAPAGVTELVGGLTARAEVARTIFGYVSRRTATSAATTAFAVSVGRPDGAAPGTSRASGRSGGKVEWRIGFTMDIVGYSARPQPVQDELQTRLVRVVEEILADAHLPFDVDYAQEAGDAMRVFLPPDVDIRRVPRLITAAADRLARDNARHTEPMRWRMAMAEGPVARGRGGFTGHGIISFCRLVESDPLRAAMKDHPDADLGLLVSDRIYQNILRQDFSPPAAKEFRQVRAAVKEFADDAWLWVPATGGEM